MDYEIALEAANRAYAFGPVPRLTVTAANLECVELSVGWGPFYLRFEVSAGQRLRAFYRDVGLLRGSRGAYSLHPLYKLNGDPKLFTLEDVEDWAGDNELVARVQDLPLGGTFEFSRGSFQRVS